MHTRGLAAGSTSFCVLAGTPLVLWLAVAAGSEPSARRSEASALAAKTSHRDEPLDASESVASWVLSPISARKTAKNVDPKSFQSMGASVNAGPRETIA